jgi:hypothetical protein
MNVTASIYSGMSGENVCFHSEIPFNPRTSKLDCIEVTPTSVTLWLTDDWGENADTTDPILNELQSILRGAEVTSVDDEEGDLVAVPLAEYIQWMKYSCNDDPDRGGEEILEQIIAKYSI